ncbi:MAG: DUF4365 domain-containing protein [Roseofilum sp. SID2]|uniref:DUF4365 domain-containing protein n=1 Tax=unclassified Roseofilum TaxID=2620099 RepID=UPI001B2B15C5|nr:MULTISPECIES: DUF4365 domain-containing protein [unclassified Roseofilum]MBP0012286.1 DUF4365 domain-containing protein [Roseofilum sp. SID3]MBP0024107.1 DUF4365 domain-containing protein [Roseofilum sp. SID2]
MKADSNSHTGRIGVAGTQLLFERLGWIFREQTIEDYGIDAHVEVVENNTATGKLIALQIKSGKSWFKEKTAHGFVFRGKKEHLEYWQKHSLPVLVVLYDDEGENAYWQVVNKTNIKNTVKAWKLTVPFEQKINTQSLEKIKSFSSKFAATNDYTILLLQDISHGQAKRYRANILLSKESTKDEIIEIVKTINSELRVRQYHSTKELKLRWQGKEAQVIFLYLYLSLDDVRSGNWICRTQWISKKLAPKFSPIKLDGENIDSETVIKWNKDYSDYAIFFTNNQLTKEVYLDTINDILIRTKPIADESIQLTDLFKRQQIDEDAYLNRMSQLEIDMKELDLQAIDVGSAPTECSDVSQRFQCLMSMAYEILQPFSENGLEIWPKRNRDYLVNEAINGYQKDLLRLEFELEKIN